MSFIKSAINQVGRDMGKVVSNKIFKDAHSTPYRRNVSSTNNNSVSQKRRNFKSEFDKAIGFQTGFKANTLISKLSGAYTVLKEESNNYISDGYLDHEESTELFKMMERFNQKVSSIYDILEIDEETNKKEIENLAKIVEKTKDLFHQTLKVSADGCKSKSKALVKASEEVEDISFSRFVGLTSIWMGGYAKTGEKDLSSTIVANILSLCLFPFVNIIMAIYGMLTYRNEINRRNALRTSYKQMADSENKRADVYLDIINNSELK